MLKKVKQNLKKERKENQSLCRDLKLYWSVLIYLLTNILVTEGYQLMYLYHGVYVCNDLK